MLILEEGPEDETGMPTIHMRPGSNLFWAATGPIELIEHLVLELGVPVTVTDPMMGYSPLHFAAEMGKEENVRWFLDHGAPWNMANHYSVTPGELALEDGFPRCYEIIFEGGVRSEYEFWRLRDKSSARGEFGQHLKGNMRGQAYYVNNYEYLSTPVSFLNPRPEIPDDFAMVVDGMTGVMMEWERPLMKETARLLCEDMGKGKNILNVGFGLGIIDSYFQSYEPGNHTIIEAHPRCLKYMRENGWYDKPNVRILAGSWDKFIGPDASFEGLGTFDVIYFDTFQEGYPGHLRFLRCVPELLSGPSALFSFFHGHCRRWKMGYEVYAEVARWHANDYGISTTWTDFQIDPATIWESFSKKPRGDISHPFKIPICRLAPTTPRHTANAWFGKNLENEESTTEK
ncbi:S-adenosyl-L-methionine-dependent methyltransferase [Sparassis latifolia]|uniref:Protein arginine N-methyltransferase 2 n=1 Tax=Sparassis crispa TaxID=139825 RepID=A0A401GVP2_9APHY|nr:Protein arginine N-methyltransferase 2 [Sparassis crispa]GBE86252.1 Protein arginine N-methyltransferase 2 [Sparassis crispa]